MRIHPRWAVVFLTLAVSGAADCLSAEEPWAAEQSSRIFVDGRQWVEEIEGTITIPNGQRLSLRSERGNLRLRNGRAGEVRYRVSKVAYRRSEEQARELFRAFVVSVRNSPSEVRILGEWQERPGWRHPGNFSVEYEITLPASFRADLETAGGEIEIDASLRALRAVTAGGNISAGDIGGETEVETAGGCISLGSIGGPLKAQTAGGDIRVEDVRGSATLETSGGAIVTGQVEGDVRGTTAGGDIHIEGATGDVHVQTAGGRIAVGEAGGRVQAQTAGGSIHVQSAGGAVQAETAGGGIELEQIRGGVRAATAAGNIAVRILDEQKLLTESFLRTSFGDVEVYLPATFAVTIDATIEMATGHKIHTDFPLKIKGEKTEFSFPPGRIRAVGDLNGGGQRLKIQTVGGEIVIRKLTEEVLRRMQERQEHLWKYKKPKPFRVPKAPKPPSPPTPPSPPGL